MKKEEHYIPISKKALQNIQDILEDPCLHRRDSEARELARELLVPLEDAILGRPCGPYAIHQEPTHAQTS